jgi:hypothetical protein
MTSRRAHLWAAAALAVVAAAPFGAQAYNGNPDYFEFDGGTTVLSPDILGNPGLSGASFGASFDGISQSTVRSLHSNFSEIPPDTMGAVGRTQFMETSNGAYAIYDKATGAQTKLWADGDFWEQAGQPAMNGDFNFSNGDSRVLFDKRSDRWIATSFGATLDQVAIAVSDTADATGGWKSTTFTGFAPGIADYPTLAIDNKAVYIATNNFEPDALGDYSFSGTTLNVISRDDLFSAGAPSVSSLQQFTTPYAADTFLGQDRGFSIQGVNQVGDDDAGQIVAIGAANFGATRYTISDPGSGSGTQSATTLINPFRFYQPNDGAAQPDGSRTIDPLDDRISSAAWELNGKIYAIHTITEVGGDHTKLEWNVIDAATNTLIQSGVIGDATHDYFQGTIAVSENGEVVISYNRSGFGPDGKIGIWARVYRTGADGALTQVGHQWLLHQSTIGDYHNGGCETCDPSGPQRWGDYAQITVDPNDPSLFWIIGEYARPYDSPVSNSRWGTWITALDADMVPEPSDWSLMLFGISLTGPLLRARRKQRGLPASERMVGARFGLS